MIFTIESGIRFKGSLATSPGPQQNLGESHKNVSLSVLVVLLRANMPLTLAESILGNFQFLYPGNVASTIKY